MHAGLSGTLFMAVVLLVTITIHLFVIVVLLYVVVLALGGVARTSVECALSRSSKCCVYLATCANRQFS